MAAALLALACGGADNQTVFDQHVPEAGAGGSVAGQQQGGTSSGSGGAASAGQATGGAAAGQAGASGGVGTAGAAGTNGGGVASSGAGGIPEGGAAQAGTGGNAGGGTAQAGMGGQADPLEPQPVPGCPGYVKVLVPKGTCVWFHGTFTFQSAECGLVSPTERKCATASAVSSDTSSIVSASAEITRFDFDQTGCPKQCN